MEENQKGKSTIALAEFNKIMYLTSVETFNILTHTSNDYECIDNFYHRLQLRLKGTENISKIILEKREDMHSKYLKINKEKKSYEDYVNNLFNAFKKDIDELYKLLKEELIIKEEGKQ